MKYKYFMVSPLPLPQGSKRKTRDYEIISGSSANGIRLGHIRFYPAWRQHVFEPEECTVWSSGCLADIRDALASIKVGLPEAGPAKEEPVTCGECTIEGCGA